MAEAETTYCTVDDVVELLQIEEPGPDVRNLIANEIVRQEQLLDDDCHRSWKTKTATNEYYEFKQSGINLLHKPVIAITSVQAYFGVNWQTLTEGRSEDYIVDYEYGIVYWVSFAWHPTRYVRYGLPRIFGRFHNSIRVSYTWGQPSSVPDSLEAACARKAAQSLINSSDFLDLFPEGTDMIDLLSKMTNWQKDVDTFVRTHKRLLSR